MAIDLSNTRRIVLFEIDRDDPHNLHRFHRAISQLMVERRISESDFEEVIGSYEGVMNVAYVMSIDGFRRAFDRIEWFMREQTELYDFDLDHCELVSWAYQEPAGFATANENWTTKRVDWARTWATGEKVTDAVGWTYFPSSKTYFTILSEEQANA